MPTLQMRQLKRMSLNQNESLRRMTSWQFWPEYSSIEIVTRSYIVMLYSDTGHERENSMS